MRLVQSLAFLSLLVAFGVEGAAGGPVLATVYYEAKCPYSRDFVVQQLLPAVLRDPELIRVVLVPFGKANVTTTPNGYTFTCQHGDTECLGNRLHACGLAIASTKTLQVSYAACLMSNYTDVEATAKACATELGLPWTTINECKNGPAGNELMRAYGNTTKDLSPPLTSVPTVTLNGSRGNQNAILHNFWDEVVKLSTEPSTKPTEPTEPTETSRASHGVELSASGLLLFFSTLLVSWKA